VSFNRQVVEKTNEASRLTAQHMRLGFLLLGICGSIAGVLTGLGIARAVSRSMVQLSVSVRGVAGKLNEVSGPVTISHIGDLQGLEFGLKNLEHQISQVVERLQQRETELLRCEQLASVGQLAAGLAHELRNPLMPMKMLVQTAMERGDEGQLAGRKLQVMYDEICRLEQSIQTFLDFARPPELKVAAVDIAGVIDDTIDLVASRARQQDVEIRCVIPPERVIAQVDRDQLRQVLLNLVLNALDELSMGGLIEVQLRPTGCEEGNFEIRLSDTGGGIRPEVLGRLFQPFATTKETGMGLGLSMCQRIIASHRGTIAIHNRPQGGAEVVIRLPIGAAANALANSPFAVAT
jgi:signal transduction histidine kinase